MMESSMSDDKMKAWFLSGTPEQIGRAARLFDTGQAIPFQAEGPASGHSEEGEAAFILRVLKRAPLSEFQKDVLVALYNAESEGLTREEIADKVGITVGQLNGVLGAFGRRVNATPGFNQDAFDAPLWALLDWKDTGNKRYIYFLRPTVRTVVKNMEIV